jgi:hypothetical protein
MSASIPFTFGSRVSVDTAAGDLFVGAVNTLSCSPTTTVREFCAAVEVALLESHRVNANAVAAFLPGRLDKALPPHEPLVRFIGDFNLPNAVIPTVAVLGDSVPVTPSMADASSSSDPTGKVGQAKLNINGDQLMLIV